MGPAGLGRAAPAATLEGMSGELPERLFRDDGGAALERVARLEDENRRLRAEIARLENGGTPPSPPSNPKGAATVLLLATAAAVLVGSATFSARVSHRHHYRPPHTPRLLETPRATPVVTPVNDADCTQPFWTDNDGVTHVKAHCATDTTEGDRAGRSDCTTPFWYDANGRKHYKRQCIFPH